jgi:NTE family protein
MTDSGVVRPIGVALGSGAARGWAHIGVLQGLQAAGLAPAVVAGTSSGAVVGAAYVLGKLEAFKAWVEALGWMDVAQLMDPRLTGPGVIAAERLFATLRKLLGDPPIESLPIPFGAVATDLLNGHEVWLTEGPVLGAVRASSALPGLFPPVDRADRYLVDGGLVNPVPVSLCRALGAQAIIAVNLNGDIVGRHFAVTRTGEGRQPPRVFDVIAGAINVMQDRITRSRMAGDPPDAMLSPRLRHVGLMEFHRGSETIRAGRECVEHMLPALRYALGDPPLQT